MIDKATSALIVVDVQNDFCPGGALAVSEGDAVIPVINRLLARAEHAVFTRDWHPENHCSFSDEPQFQDMSWPRHCVAFTPGAAFREGLAMPANPVVVSKGKEPDHEAYSGFQGTDLLHILREKNVLTVLVAGLATDYCAKHTAIDAARAGFRTLVVEDAIRGVDVPAGSAAKALEAMQAAGVQLTTSAELGAAS